MDTFYSEANVSITLVDDRNGNIILNEILNGGNIVMIIFVGILQ